MSESATYAIGQGSLRLISGDITKDDADAIVNAANSALAGGGGVDGAIHRAAGPKLPGACRKIIDKIGRLPAGGAVITPGFDLPARYIIHTVRSIWRGGDEGEPDKLRSAYTESLGRAVSATLTSIAFPAISCGVYGYPVELAAPGLADPGPRPCNRPRARHPLLPLRQARLRHLAHRGRRTVRRLGARTRAEGRFGPPARP